jgi:hypothetical protein
MEQIKPIDAVFAELHHIVALAGGLNFSLRTTGSVFVTEWPKPDDAYDLEAEDLDPSIFESSYKSAREACKRYGASAPRRTEALVQIAAAPKMTAYTPRSGGRMISHRLLPEHAVFYSGLQDHMDPPRARISLDQHVKRERQLAMSWVAFLLRLYAETIFLLSCFYILGHVALWVFFAIMGRRPRGPGELRLATAARYGASVLEQFLESLEEGAAGTMAYFAQIV